jgi:hypothetical protein
MTTPLELRLEHLLLVPGISQPMMQFRRRGNENRVATNSAYFGYFATLLLVTITFPGLLVTSFLHAVVPHRRSATTRVL